MRSARFYTDPVTLIKQDETTVKGIKAIVEKKKIYIQGNEPLIESGDYIQRKMSNSGEEMYEVIDPGFYENSHRNKAGYQMEVRKLGIPEAKSAIQNITFNVTGNNPRINQNSVDQSVNLVRLSSDVTKKIKDLRKEINQHIKDKSQQSEAHEVVDAIEDQFKSGSPKQAVVRTLVQGLPAVGNIASVGSFLLSCFS